ncbi:PAS domain-containing sensor histidine kinase [Allocoleopsis sp.]|uniref:PAS domain-containing sensor histidine kinase n=1 Tax=Allocoleopsis sp. TaxID=3088169 RepID=UPI002FCFF13D
MILAEFFIPHGHCYLWKPGLVGLHIVADALTALAYYSIPVTLTYFVAKRRDVPFNWIFLLFSAFIISCGTTHIMEIWTLWHPNYWLSGLIKACTAVVSLYTAFELVLLLPQALAIPSTAQLEKEIQERQRIEQELRVSEQRYRSVVTAMSEGIVLQKADGRITACNLSAERILGLTAQQMQLFTSMDFSRETIHEDGSPFPGELHPAMIALRTGKPQHNVIMGIHKLDGSFTWITINSQPLFHIGETQPYAVVTSFSDITKRKMAEEALRSLTQQEHKRALQLEQTLQQLTRTQSQLVQNEKMASLGQLLAGVAHEINNPTNFIYGNIYVASDYAQDLLHLVELYQKHYPQPVAEIAEQIQKVDLKFITSDFPKLLASMKEGTHRISEIVQSLRIFSRLDEIECKPIDIHEGIDSALLILNHRLTQNPDSPKIQVIKEYGELPLVECYPCQLHQVFMNILSNAIDALEYADRSWVMGDEEESSNYPLPISHYQSPTIRIHTEVVEDKRVVIRIADNGSGIKADIQLRIFDPFFTTKPVGKGTGLGLSISYQIVVEKHEGQLRCHSVPHQGTEFVIELPIARHSSGIDQRALAALH